MVADVLNTRCAITVLAEACLGRLLVDRQLKLIG